MQFTCALLAKPVDLISLTAFVETARHDSFSAAARQLGQSPSAVSRAVDRLEHELGIRLFARTTRQLRLTEEGEVFLEQTREILDALAAAKHAAQGAGKAPSGSLRVSLPVVFGRCCVAPLLGAFQHRYPQLRLDIAFTDRRVDLIEENIDVAVRIGALADSRLVARAAGHVHYRVCGSPDYFRMHGVPASLDDLRDHRCVHFRYPGTATPFRWQFHSEGKTVRWRPEGPIAVDDADALVGAGIGAAGLIYVPTYRVREHLASGALQSVLDDVMPSPQPVSILFTHSQLLAPRVRAFVDFFSTRIA